MKRIFLACMLLAGAMTAVMAQENNVIEVNTPEELRNIAKETLYNGVSYYQSRIVLMADITLEGDSILPIGLFPGFESPAVPLQGTFDGNGHVITIKAPFVPLEFTDESYDGYMRTEIFCGLFGSLGQEAVIQNLAVVMDNPKGQIFESMGSGMGHVGIIAGYNAGVINNCHCKGNLTVKADGHHFANFGGIAGTVDQTGYICNSTNETNLIVSHFSDIGGIVGKSFCGVVFNCTNKGDLTVPDMRKIGGDGRNVGGIVGENYSTRMDMSPYVINCINSGKIVVPENAISVGGIAGTCRSDALIFYCGNMGDVVADASYTGGVVGRLMGALVICSYHSGYLRLPDNSLIDNEVVGIRWYGDEPLDHTFVIADGAKVYESKKTSPGAFERKANGYFSKAEGVLLKYLNYDKKSYRAYFHPKKWTLPAEQLYPTFE